ncbi:MAG: response regulator [Bacteroidetes bacterium]|nr:response regulator [Bacteroidota bacterium]
MKPKILAIDDEPMMRTILTSTFKEVYDVVAVGSGEKALEWLEENLPDLVICDIQMQPMDGYAFLDIFRNRPYTENTPIIMLSGVEEKKERVKCYRKKAQDFLSKPFNKDELFELISKNLDPIYYKHRKEVNPAPSVKKKILVIDDDPTMRMILVKFLSVKYIVEAKGDGQAALEWLERNPIDLVICDIQMKPMNGYDFITVFRNRGYSKHTPVIMLSGEEKTKERVRCYQLRAQDFLTKPFNPEELEELINKNLKPVNCARKW